MNSKNSERIYLFDNLKVVLIFLVVFGHCIEIFMNNSTLRNIYVYIYLFHMPTFVFVSGYFFKKRNKKILFLIIKYFIFQFLYLLVIELIYQSNDFSINSLLDPYWIMWYMYCLIFWNLVMNIIKIKDKQSGIILIIISVIIALLVGNVEKINKAYSLSRMIVFFPFFLLGVYFKKFFDIRQFQFNQYTKIAVILSFAIIGLIWCLLTKNISIEAMYHSKPYIVTGTNSVIRFVQYIIGFIFIVGFLVITPNKKYKLSFIGANTEYIYLLHGFIVIILKVLYSNHGIKSIVSTNIWMQLLICFILTVLIIFIIMSFMIFIERVFKNNKVRNNEQKKS